MNSTHYLYHGTWYLVPGTKTCMTYNVPPRCGAVALFSCLTIITCLFTFQLHNSRPSRATLAWQNEWLVLLNTLDNVGLDITEFWLCWRPAGQGRHVTPAGLAGTNTPNINVMEINDNPSRYWRPILRCLPLKQDWRYKLVQPSWAIYKMPCHIIMALTWYSI